MIARAAAAPVGLQVAEGSSMTNAGTLPILVINTGSSTFKWTLFTNDERSLGGGTEEWNADDALTRKAQIEERLRTLPPCQAVGHRVVHGGETFEQSVVIDENVRHELGVLLPLDLLHMQPALTALDAATEAFPGAVQVACFDTAFHRTMSEAAAGYGLPAEWTQRWGLRRFGFHGLSVAWSVDSVRRLAERLPSRIIIAHLGSGCSVTAVRDGHSVDTTMGFTPLEGLMMSTRSGSVDPGVLFHLHTHHGVSMLDLEDTLTNRSGLLGVSGISSDMRLILAAADQGDANARLAYDRFILYARRAVGAMSGVLGGADMLVFTGGVGEHQPRVRRDITGALDAEALDTAANDKADEGFISRPEGSLGVLVVRAREDLVVLREVRRLADAARSPPASA